MAKHPRVSCPSCKRPVAGTPTKRIGVVSVNDHKVQPRSLTLCPGSMQHVQVDNAMYVQEMFIVDDDETPEEPATIF